MSKIAHVATGVLALVSLASLAGCAHAPPPAPVVTTAAVTPRGVELSTDIRRLCKIDDVDRTPKFDFDSADLSTNDRYVLVQVARCLTSGPLRGRAVVLTGRADPRGEAEYNMALGDSRAAQVDQYLKHLGVDPMQMTATSRGELDATGTDEVTWKRDRRVDLRLAVPAPVAMAE
jgi:peptidoglycan-associated lipoprotein